MFDLQTLFPVISTVASVYLVITVGAILRGVDWLSRSHSRQLMHVVICVLLPALIVRSIIGNQMLQDWRALYPPPLFAAGYVLLSFLLLWLFTTYATRLHGIEDEAARRTFVFSAAVFNYGFIPLPLVVALLDGQALGILFLHNVGVETCMWTVGVALLSATHQASWRRIVNPPVVAIVVASLLNLSGAQHWLPPSILSAIGLLADACIPVSLLLIGSTMANELLEPHEPTRGLGWRIALWACLWRLLLLPVLMIAMARAFPLSAELRQVLAIQAAMPAGAMPIVLAAHYGGRPAVAVVIVLSTAAVSLFTIPLWIPLAMRLLQV